eukprot:TRINITY_DN10526_c0_g1_i1.p1 TRINITY_DN10526_c0_g1~~TRINITY_DN10526_c0_g1_i1.p1  ORF type:complete len:262 (+),score=37.25 TRINITY_DN10526_c0_g1_i1:64-849(+)
MAEDVTSVAAHCDYFDAVPHPLPPPRGWTQEPAPESCRSGDDAHSDGAPCGEQADGAGAKLLSAFRRGGTLVRKRTADAWATVLAPVQRRQDDRYRGELEARMRMAFPEHAAAGEEVVFSCLCDCWNGRTASRMTGRILLTHQRALFHSQDHGRFSIEWTDVLSVQSAVVLRTTCGDPFFMSTPFPTVKCTALQLYLPRGRVYQFYRCRGGKMLRHDHPETFTELHVMCDRLWRARVDVSKLVRERGDFRPRLPAFAYNSD